MTKRPSVIVTREPHWFGGITRFDFYDAPPMRSGDTMTISYDDSIIDLEAAREERTPHLSGMARCLACRVEWAAVAPAGTVWMECPACSLERGRFIESAHKAGPHWYCCGCGCDLFHILVDGYYCPNCGSDGKHEFPAA